VWVFLFFTHIPPLTSSHSRVFYGCGICFSLFFFPYNFITTTLSPSPILHDINPLIMPPLRRFTSWLAMAVALAILVYFGLPSYRLGEPSIAGKKAQDFALTINGKLSPLSNLKGKFVVLNFWASYCGTCVEEIPSLNRLYQRIASRGGVVLGVSIDEDPAAY
jgi:hypothetical protein